MELVGQGPRSEATNREAAAREDVAPRTARLVFGCQAVVTVPRTCRRIVAENAMPFSVLVALAVVIGYYIWLQRHDIHPG